ncbi:MAG TPA: hypothetical protein VM370_00330 [Candidatus Thermoplasmatota archaeon]|nr:hypothetical protein [Candidatus Thermoplasmatota archaeon]
MPNNSTAPGGGFTGGTGGAAGGFSIAGARGSPFASDPPESQATAVIEFRIVEPVEPKILKSATADALDAARDALTHSGKVRAVADAGAAADGQLRVRVELRIEGVGVDAITAKSVEAAFVRAFLSEMASNGVIAEYRG